MAQKNMGVWGIDLGQCALKAIRLEVVDGQVASTAYDYIEHPKILSQPDADPDQLTREALEQFLSRNKLHGDMVAISVPGQSGLARFVKLPPVEEKKIGDIVRFEAKQQIPFPLEEVVWDFQKIGAGMVTDGFALETEIGLFAIKRDMVSRYLQHFKDVNVEVHLVQMAPLALCNYVAYDLLKKDNAPPAEGEGDSGKKACVVALEIGTDNSNLVICDGEKIIWQRPIPLGGNHFTRALTKDLKLTFAKAEHLKRNAVKSPDLKKILAALKTVLNDFMGEVQRSLGYFTNTHRDAQIQYMVGLGNAFRLPGLQKYLQEKLQLEVRKLTSFERMTGEEVSQAPQFTENVLSFGVAYGLALQGLKLTRLQTNLLPYEIRVERMVRAKKPWAVAAAASLLLAVAGLAFARNIDFRAVDPKKPENEAATKAAKDVLARKADFEARFNAAKGDYDESVLAIRKIGSGVQERYNWDLLYRYINMALPMPNGDKVARKAPTSFGVLAYKEFVTDKAGAAHREILKKRYARAGDPKSGADVDEKLIKPYLIQINIEGITHRFFDDLSPYFDAVRQRIISGGLEGLTGMDPNDFERIKAKKDLPKKGWVVEVRGYTHHKENKRFVINTFLENLLNPKGVGNVLSKDMKEKVKDRMSYLWAREQIVKNPDPGQFELINTSTLAALSSGGGGKESKGPPGGQGMPDMKGGGGGGGGGGGKGGGKGAGASRSSWKPIGERASAVIGGGSGAKDGSLMANNPNSGKARPAAAGARQPRTEFAILFIWQEPTLEDAKTQSRP
ncbi:MAG: type IV pilus assembly protein PilM [Planctomycetes bacterium]|nr:type IV pilus assembly protein PilM [Planctomycetota bacterium]